MAANQGWFNEWFANGHYPSVWFAPGDESHLTPEETYRPTDAGMAPTNLRFEPIWDAEATPTRAGAGFAARTTKANGEANAPVGRVSVRISSMGARATGRTPQANGYARPIRGGGALYATRAVSPVGDSQTQVTRAGVQFVTRRGTASADAAAFAGRSVIEVLTRGVRPQGVLNPTDEELLLLVRRRMLTRTTSGAKTRAWIPRY